jgi:hypothetical protein
MRSVFHSNVVTIGLMGVLLLLASAVGRVTATNVNAWLSGYQARPQQMSTDAPAGTDLAALSAWKVR